MATYRIGDSGAGAQLPRVRVAVIRHQGETMLSPSHDVVPFLEAQDSNRWTVRVFDERDFGGALGAASGFDVIVLGYNATTFSPELQAALCAAPPTAPVLIMHQRDQPCYDFLRDELAVQVAKLGDGISAALIPRERKEGFEPALNWPHAGLIGPEGLPTKAIRGLSFRSDGAWRVVLEAQRAAQRLPVLIRTRSDHPQRIVACSLLLRPGIDEAHGQLLENLLVYCAFGWPDVGLVRLAGDDEAAARVNDLALGMGMWSERCVEVTIPDPDALPIDAWPLRGVKRVVMGAELAPDLSKIAGAGDWLQRGGELIRVGADGAIAVQAELNDRFIVLQRWAMWFGALPQEGWLGRISTARAVLRMLDAVLAYRSELPEDLRFDADPAAYRSDIALLLTARVRRGHVDETISATAAALDLDRLTGEAALPGYVRVRVRRWLEQHLEGASRSDQLDILRSLADRELLSDYLREWRDDGLTTTAVGRVDALVATRLREAVHVCWPDGDEPEDLFPDELLVALDGSQVVEDLRHGPLLCADFLAAIYCRSPRSTGASARLFDPARYGESIAAAVQQISAVDLFTDPRYVGAACSHTLAILRHLERHPGGLRFLADRGELPPSAAQSVLQEATKARNREREARHDLPTLGITVFLLGTVTLALATVGLFDLLRIAGFTVSIHPWWLMVPIVLVPAAALAGLRWRYLERHEVSERRDLRLAQNAIAAAALALAFVPATLVWRIAAPKGDVTSFALALAPLAGATAFAVLLVILAYFKLAPVWATSIPTLLSDIKAPLTALTKKLPAKTPPQ